MLGTKMETAAQQPNHPHEREEACLRTQTKIKLKLNNLKERGAAFQRHVACGGLVIGVMADQEQAYSSIGAHTPHTRPSLTAMVNNLHFMNPEVKTPLGSLLEGSWRPPFN